MINVVIYTEKEALRHICLTEEHINDYINVKKGNVDGMSKCAMAISEGKFASCSVDEAAQFCLDCLSKHALTISGLAKEGVRYIPSKKKAYTELFAVANELFDDLPNFNEQLANTYINALRNIRKKWISHYLITGKLAHEGYADNPPTPKSNDHTHLT